ncbi:hypothetical protein ABH966_001143 [Lysinibacillus sp. RC46]|uniref:hypothetical protein n=1 Tax=Lysinibacillus sp. RC46 TaxID=3156295 RepID=UPI0035152240
MEDPSLASVVLSVTSEVPSVASVILSVAPGGSFRHFKFFPSFQWFYPSLRKFHPSLQ